jgi:hypothetical protein
MKKQRREYMRAYQRAWVAARRTAWFADKRCVVCESKENLELHHIDPKTKVSHRVWSWSQVRRDVELSKCEVRCEKHHMDVTMVHLKEMNPKKPMVERKHGTNTTYNYHGCRCGECCEWRRSKYERLGT